MSISRYDGVPSSWIRILDLIKEISRQFQFATFGVELDKRGMEEVIIGGAKEL